MRATELRLGNLIMDGKDIEVVTPRIITMLENGEAEFDPIPLTEEWLEKFEWYEVDEGRYTFIDNNYFSITANGSLYHLGEYTAVDAPYLHQLQNLYFALTGQELTLKTE